MPVWAIPLEWAVKDWLAWLGRSKDLVPADRDGGRRHGAHGGSHQDVLQGDPVHVATAGDAYPCPVPDGSLGAVREDIAAGVWLAGLGSVAVPEDSERQPSAVGQGTRGDHLWRPLSDACGERLTGWIRHLCPVPRPRSAPAASGS